VGQGNVDNGGEAGEDAGEDAGGDKDRSVWGKQWNARLVAGHQYKDLVQEGHEQLIKEGQTTFSAYQPALTRVMNGLSDEQIKECAEQVKAWNAGPWLKDLQQECVSAF
jgi:hypothetical protein